MAGVCWGGGMQLEWPGVISERHQRESTVAAVRRWCDVIRWGVGVGRRR